MTCIVNSTAKTITIPDGFKVREVIPKNITFSISYFKNPSAKILTDSFNITTLTQDGYIID
jgi:hypothetical protein